MSLGAIAREGIRQIKKICHDEVLVLIDLQSIRRAERRLSWRLTDVSFAAISRYVRTVRDTFDFQMF